VESSSDIWVSIIFGGLAFLLAGALAVVKANMSEGRVGGKRSMSLRGSGGAKEGVAQLRGNALVVVRGDLGFVRVNGRPPLDFARGELRAAPTVRRRLLCFAATLPANLPPRDRPFQDIIDENNPHSSALSRN